MKIINCSQINFFIEFLNRLVVVNLNCNNLKQKKYIYIEKLEVMEMIGSITI